MATTVTLAKLEAVTQLATEVDQKLALKADASALALKADASALASKVSTNDARLSDARTPTAHSQGMDTITGLAEALAGKVGTSDARLSDARTPTAHSHAISDVSGLAEAIAAAGSSGGGGAGSSAKLVASGNISAPGVVALNDDGTVSSIAISAEAVTGLRSLGTGLPAYNNGHTLFCSAQNKVVFLLSGSGGVYYFVGTVTQNDVTFSARKWLTLVSDTYDWKALAAYYDAPTDRIVLMSSWHSYDYGDGSDYTGYLDLHTLQLSGDTLSQVARSTAFTFTDDMPNYGAFSALPDSTKFAVLIGQPGGSVDIYDYSVSASTITRGTGGLHLSTGYAQAISAALDTANKRLWVGLSIYGSPPSSGLWVVSYVSGVFSLVSSGTTVSSNSFGLKLRYIPQFGAMAALFHEDNGSPYQYCLIYTTGPSGPLTATRRVQCGEGSPYGSTQADFALDYDEGSKTLLLLVSQGDYYDGNVSSRGKLVMFTPDPNPNTTVTVSSRFIGPNAQLKCRCLINVPTLGRTVGLFVGITSSEGSAFIHSPPSSNVRRRVGYAAAAAVSGAAVSVSLPGAVVTGLSGLTPRLPYYADDSGVISTIKTAYPLGYALNPTQLLLSFTLP